MSTFQQAIKKCSSIGGTVYKPRSDKELRFIRAASPQRSFWVDSFNATHWRDGTPISKNWDPTFPFRNRCAVVARRDSGVDGLCDVACDAAGCTVCEVIIVPSTEMPITEPSDIQDDVDFNHLLSNFTKPVTDSLTLRMGRVERRLEQMSNLVINRGGNVNLTDVHEAIDNIQRNQNSMKESIAQIKKIMTQLYKTIHGEK